MAEAESLRKLFGTSKPISLQCFENNLDIESISMVWSSVSVSLSAFGKSLP